MAGIREILIISTPNDLPNFEELLGDGSRIGCSFHMPNKLPKRAGSGICDREQFIGKDKVSLILGDNIFFGNGLSQIVHRQNDPEGGIVFAYHVNDPERYGVVEFDETKAFPSRKNPKAKIKFCRSRALFL